MWRGCRIGRIWINDPNKLVMRPNSSWIGVTWCFLTFRSTNSKQGFVAFRSLSEAVRPAKKMMCARRLWKAKVYELLGVAPGLRILDAVHTVGWIVCVCSSIVPKYAVDHNCSTWWDAVKGDKPLYTPHYAVGEKERPFLCIVLRWLSPLLRALVCHIVVYLSQTRVKASLQAPKIIQEDFDNACQYSCFLVVPEQWIV
jgi:hypothetical protein